MKKLSQIRQAHYIRRKVLQKLSYTSKILYPNDHFNKEDVAFGVLDNNEFLVASDFKNEVEIGYIAHIILLILKGYAKDETDTHPIHDYKVRGIVKKSLNKDIVFWETPQDLLENTNNYKALQQCLKELKKRKLIKDKNRVFGSGTSVDLGTVEDFI